jgi:hypothetical protein
MRRVKSCSGESQNYEAMQKNELRPKETKNQAGRKRSLVCAIYRHESPRIYAVSRHFTPFLAFFEGGEGYPSLMFKVQSLKSVWVDLVCYSSVLLGLARGRGAATLDFFSVGRRLILA